MVLSLQSVTGSQTQVTTIMQQIVVLWNGVRLEGPPTVNNPWVSIRDLMTSGAGLTIEAIPA